VVNEELQYYSIIDGLVSNKKYSIYVNNEDDQVILCSITGEFSYFRIELKDN
jgi:hypothetical protein